jgi:hypothetical protein
VKIDDRIEAMVREGLQSAVRRDVDRLDRAMKAFPDEASRAAAAHLMMSISAYVMTDLYGGKPPTDDQVRALAAKVAETEDWSNLPANEVAEFMRLVLGDQSIQLDPVSAGLLAFVVTASLLIGRPMPEGKHWFNYLDQVEAALELQSAS